jgi:hypothetical protein
MPDPAPWHFVLPSPPPAVGYRNIQSAKILLAAAERESFDYFQTDE